TKSLASDSSRRSMLKSIAIVATGGVVALFGARTAEAQHKKKAHCAHENEACGGNTGVSCCGSLVCAGPIGNVGGGERGRKERSGASAADRASAFQRGSRVPSSLSLLRMVLPGSGAKHAP